MPERFTAAERASLIAEVRARRAEDKAAGYADGGTGLHIDALIEEIDERKTITDAELADQLWNTVIINDMFDEKLAPVRDALRDVCKRLVGHTVTAAEP